jgi:hypothetical protein
MLYTVTFQIDAEDDAAAAAVRDEMARDAEVRSSDVARLHATFTLVTVDPKSGEVAEVKVEAPSREDAIAGVEGDVRVATVDGVIA